MADDADGAAEGEIEAGPDRRTATEKEQGSALNRITDVQEERQLNSAKVQDALRRLAATEGERAEAQRAREKELAAVKINAADVELLAAEAEWDKKKAERQLREHKGDVAAALRSLLQPTAATT